MPLIRRIQEFSRTQLIFVSVVGVVVLLFVLIFVGVIPGRRGGAPRANIVVWGVDDERAWRTTIANFEEVYPNVDVDYVEVSGDAYESKLLNDLAAGRGPDVFMFKSTWLPKHKDKIVPASPEKIRTETFRGLFPQVAEEDFLADERVWALPLSIDTLAFVYNRDIFDEKGIVFPPRTWAEFEAAVGRLREFEGGSFVQAAASIGGTSGNVLYADDLLSLFMLQRGVPMVNERFDRADLAGPEGTEAVAFYTQFGNPESPLYTWNSSMSPTIDAFVRGEAAAIFAYAEDAAALRDQNPALDFNIAPMPQLTIGEPVNIARYWGLAVSNRAPAPDAAWDFVVFSATNQENAVSYFEATGRPPALRFLIERYLRNPNVGIFASQALTAKSWPRPDEEAVRSIFDTLIEAVIAGEPVGQELRRAETSITAIIRTR